MMPNHTAIITQQETYCPNCSKAENKIEICKWCKYEYPEEEWGWGDTLFLIGVIIIPVALILLISYYTL